MKNTGVTIVAVCEGAEMLEQKTSITTPYANSLTPEYIIENDILPYNNSGWKPRSSQNIPAHPIFKEMGFNNGVTIVAQFNQLIISDNSPQVIKEPSLKDIAHKYLSTLSHLDNYHLQDIGLNFAYFIKTSSAPHIIEKLLLIPQTDVGFNKKYEGASFELAYTLDDCVLTLRCGSGYQNKDEGIVIASNFNKKISSNDISFIKTLDEKQQFITQFIESVFNEVIHGK